MKKYCLLVSLIYLSAQGFFNPFGIIAPQTSKFLFYLISVLSLGYAIRKRTVDYYPKVALSFVIFGILGSSVMASLYHEQSYVISVVAILPFFFAYLFFYVLMKLKPPIDFIEHLFKWLTIASLVMYTVNLISFPNVVFGETKEEYDMSRGFARMGVPMIEIVVIYFFYNINICVNTRKKSSFLWIFVTLFMIFMSLTRQIILMSIVLGVLLLMHNMHWLKKILIIVSCILMACVVLPKIPIIKTMIDLSEEQIMDNRRHEDIRVTAWKFYTTEFQTNKLSPLFGNGVPSFGNSRWGNYVEQTTSVRSEGGNACFTVDVGWAGFYWYFGIIATIGLLFLIIKALAMRKASDMLYLSYSLAFILITSIASGPILFHGQICGISLLLYLSYAKKDGNSYPQL